MTKLFDLNPKYFIISADKRYIDIQIYCAFSPPAMDLSDQIIKKIKNDNMIRFLKHKIIFCLNITAIMLLFTEGMTGEWIASEKNRSHPPIIIALDADMTSGSAESGVAIQRGMSLAVEEINAGGGVLDRPFKIVVRDHRGNPARGIDNIIELSGMKDLVAVFGGLHTPVAMAELKTLHKHKMIYLGPWAAGTPVVDNGYTPNFVFRISVRDALAGGFLINKAVQRGFKRPALLLENTGWGRSNEKAMTKALLRFHLHPVTVQWFNWGIRNIQNQLNAIVKAKADVIMLVANAPEGTVIVQEIAALPVKERIPLISHWGITGGHFFKDSQSVLKKVDLSFLQTFSFLSTTSQKRSLKVATAYIKRYHDTKSIKRIKSPGGVAHAYDLVHVLAKAIRLAGSIQREKVRDALEQVKSFSGLVKRYAPPFTPKRHDALTMDDFHLARYDNDGAIIRIDEQ